MSLHSATNYHNEPLWGDRGHYAPRYSSVPWGDSLPPSPGLSSCRSGPYYESRGHPYYDDYDYQLYTRRKQFFDMRDPALMAPPPRQRSPYQDTPDIISGFDCLSLNTKDNHMARKALSAANFANGLSPQNKPYFETRYGRNNKHQENDANRLTWSQTRRIHNLNRPMIPVSIKIPLHDKHLWWESPTVTLNMFAPYSSSLVNGEKTIETRNYQLPNKCKGVRIGIVEIMPKSLPSKKPELIGEVVFVDCKEYTSKEEWEADAPYHKVDVDDERFGWREKKKKYGWVVHTWQVYDRAIREAASEYCNTRVHYTKNFFVWAYV